MKNGFRPIYRKPEIWLKEGWDIRHKITDKDSFLKIYNVLVETYMVPAMRVLMWVSSSSFNFAKPKSEILALSSLSSNTLLVLISLCTIFIIDSSCRYIKPLATPRQIFCLVGQSSFILNFASFPEIMGGKKTINFWIPNKMPSFKMLLIEERN